LDYLKGGALGAGLLQNLIGRLNLPLREHRNVPSGNRIVLIASESPSSKRSMLAARQRRRNCAIIWSAEGWSDVIKIRTGARLRRHPVPRHPTPRSLEPRGQRDQCAARQRSGASVRGGAWIGNPVGRLPRLTGQAPPGVWRVKYRRAVTISGNLVEENERVCRRVEALHMLAFQLCHEAQWTSTICGAE
jgi:hypothetical protein